ncbi:MAG: YeeE/YedE family protein, partial [Betaproteobacteria bacterium]|nr:YeeE/YedE family protein [Betaproteobacteria bacterium]
MNEGKVSILIGLSAVLLLAATGRIAGISGIVGGLMKPAANDIGWRVAFVVGLIAGPLAVGALTGNASTVTVTSSTGVLVAAGV